MTDLLNKYQPEDIKDFVGNRMLIKSLLDKLDPAHFPCELLIFGPSGSGKTLLCDLALKKYASEYDVLRISGVETEATKRLKQLIDNFVNNRTIESFLSKRKKKFILFDNVDIMMSSDRNVSGFLLSFVEHTHKSKNVSYIMTCSTSEEKRLTELKKHLDCIRLANPTIQDVFLFVSAILDTEDIEYEASRLLKLIDTHNNNIRNVINNLHHMSLSDKELSDEKKTKLMFDSSVFDIMKKLYTQELTVNEMRSVSENGLVPLLMHENLLTELQKNKVKQSKETYFSLLNRVTRNFIVAEKIEHYMYQNTDWNLYDMVSILKCSTINQALTSLQKKKTANYEGYIFTQMLTKAALRCNYNKRLGSLQSSLGIFELDALYYFLDCLSNEMIEDVTKIKGVKQFLTNGEFRLGKEDISTLQQYFSLFVVMDKTILNKFKKIM